MEEIVEASDEIEKRIYHEMSEEEKSPRSSFQRSLTWKETKKSSDRILEDIARRCGADQPKGSASPLRQKSTSKFPEIGEPKSLSNVRVIADSEETPEEVRISANKDRQTIVGIYDAEICRLKSQLSELLFRVNQDESAVAARDEQIRSLKRSSELLRRKVRILSEKETEDEMKLKLFSSMKPLVDLLKKEYPQKSLSEILSIIDMMEKNAKETQDLYENATKETAELEVKTGMMRKELEGKWHSEVASVLSLKEESDRLLTETERRISDLEVRVRIGNEHTDQYLSLNSAIMDLWHRWSSTMRKANESAPPVGEPDITRPLHVITSLHNLFTEYSPEVAEKKCREISAVADRIWVRHFANRLDIKSSPLLIFEEAARSYDQTTGRIAELERQLSIQKGSLRENEVIGRALQTELRESEGELQRRRDSPGGESPERRDATKFERVVRFEALPAPLSPHSPQRLSSPTRRSHRSGGVSTPDSRLGVKFLSSSLPDVRTRPSGLRSPKSHER